MSYSLTPFESARLHTTFTGGCWHHHYVGTSEGSEVELVETWRKGKILGGGSFGTLYLAEKTGFAVRAVKQVLKVNAPAPIRYRELQALIMLNKYPDHFVKFFGWWEDEESIYFSMDFIQGGDLKSLIRSHPLTENDARTIARQLLKALQIMHQNDICHRDLKPDNVLVVSPCTQPLIVKLADFGCSKYTVGTDLRSEVGTPGYMAPEILDNDDPEAAYTFAVDIWSLGCLVYAIIAKRPPERQYTYVHRGAPFPDGPLIARNLSAVGITFIRSLLAPRPEDRLDVAQALHHLWLMGEYRDNGEGREDMIVSFADEQDEQSTNTITALSRGSMEAMAPEDMGGSKTPGSSPDDVWFSTSSCGKSSEDGTRLSTGVHSPEETISMANVTLVTQHNEPQYYENQLLEKQQRLATTVETLGDLRLPSDPCSVMDEGPTSWTTFPKAGYMGEDRLPHLFNPTASSEGSSKRKRSDSASNGQQSTKRPRSTISGMESDEDLEDMDM